MNVQDTRVPQAGVMRCCLASVAEEYVGSKEGVELGFESSCKYCKRKFRLIDTGRPHPVWIPIDFIEKGTT